MSESSLRDEAIRLVALAESAGVPLRVLGGVAIEILVPAWRGRVGGPGRDIDVATNQASRRTLTELLEHEGYEADRRYNAANGHKQLYFVDTSRGRPLDVLIDRMEMCHKFNFRDSLAEPGPTLSPADLLLSKLQIVKLNEKDIVDAFVLLSAFHLGPPGSGGIDVDRIVGYCATDWGWWRTTTANLAALDAYAAETAGSDRIALVGTPEFDPRAQVERLRRAIDEAPKSLSWRLRSRVGDRVPWYDEPEEEAHR